MSDSRQGITVVKHALDGRPPVSYEAQPLEAPAGWVAARAIWVHGTVDLGDIVFHNDDVLHEYFSLDRPYNAFAVFRTEGAFGGWYCNVTRPTVVKPGEIHWHDLLIDVIVTPDWRIVVHDEEDVIRFGIPDSDPELAELIYRGRDELIQRIRAASYPFSEVVPGQS